MQKILTGTFSKDLKQKKIYVFRKYSNVKRWEANLRAYQGLSSAPQTSRRQKAAQRFEDSDWLDGPTADVENSKNMTRPLPPPPSPTVKSLATLPH